MIDLFKNPSLKKMMIGKLKKFSEDSGQTKVFLDLSNPEDSVQFVDENSILVNKQEYDFLKKFYTENKDK